MWEANWRKHACVTHLLIGLLEFPICTAEEACSSWQNIWYAFQLSAQGQWVDFLKQLRGEIDAKLSSSKFKLFLLISPCSGSSFLSFFSWLCTSLGQSCVTWSALQIWLFKYLGWSIKSYGPTFLKSADAYQFELTKAKIPSADWFGSDLWVIILEGTVYLKEQILEEAQWHIAFWNLARVVMQGSNIFGQSWGEK